jgi:hypothetical protein
MPAEPHIAQPVPVPVPVSVLVLVPVLVPVLALVLRNQHWAPLEQSRMRHQLGWQT